MNATTKPESAALAIAPRQQFDLSPQTFDQALTFSNYLADSDMVPKDFKGKPGNCLIAMQWGAELGLKPLQALQNLAIINGRPSLWGDAVIALVRGSPLCEYVVEDDDGKTAICKVKRRGEPEQSRSFSMEDAKAAGLAGKQGPWTQYPKRMRQMRARAFALRDVFPDVLRGLPVAEELMDTPPEKHMGAADVVPPSATPAPTPAKAPALEPWPDDKLEARFGKYREWLAAGKTADEIVAFAETKGTLTDAQKAKIRALAPAQAAAQGPDANANQATDVTPKVTFAHVAERINAAQDRAQLAEAADLIGEVADEKQRAELAAIHQRRDDELPF